MVLVMPALFVLCLIAIAFAMKIVPQTDNLLIKRFGKYSRTLAAGVHLTIPFFDRVAHKEIIIERQLPAKKVPSFTKNNVQIEVTLAILYRVTDAAGHGTGSRMSIKLSKR